MVKGQGGSGFRPGRGGGAAPRPAAGRNGPSDKGTGTTHTAHPNTGTNRSGGSGGHDSNTTQWKPGSSGG